jgi:5-methylthioadenosine/S-adenosylhomocysteine deaminase
VYHPLSHLVYAAGRDAVTDVWVRGRRLLDQGRLTTLDVAALKARAHQWQIKIAPQA